MLRFNEHFTHPIPAHERFATPRRKEQGATSLFAIQRQSQGAATGTLYSCEFATIYNLNSISVDERFAAPTREKQGATSVFAIQRESQGAATGTLYSFEFTTKHIGNRQVFVWFICVFLRVFKKRLDLVMTFIYIGIPRN